jgi:peptidoglycan hydrolase-like protein with peptidoglycan-binding domain
MKRTLGIVRGAGAITVIASLTGCSGQDQPSHSEPIDLTEVRVELSAGHRGPAVAAVNSYLGQFGYFPSTALSERYPYFEPVIDEAPPDSQFFGSQTEQAVRAFQRKGGLFETGRVDRETLALMQQPRCDNPEHELFNVDDSEKFALLGWDYTGTNPITYRITAYTSDLSPSAVKLAIARAFGTWRNNSDRNFTEITSGTPNIEIKFFPRGSPPAGWTDFSRDDVLAYANKTRMAINDNYNWAFVQGNLGTVDLESVVLHESGHSLGLDHSSVTAVNTPVMYPSVSPGSTRRGLTVDDSMGIGVRYHVWTQRPGTMRDLAGGGTSLSAIYGIGDNNTIWRWNGSGWTAVEGNGASIAVDSARNPWVTSSDNSIWSWTALGWLPVLGSARDIGIGYGAPIWSVSTTASGSNFFLQRWNGFSWDRSDGVGVRVTVDGSGRVWAVQANGTVVRRTTATGFSGSWETLPGCGKDIAGGSQSVWAIGCTSLGSGNFNVQIWNEQIAVGSAPAKKNWLTVPGAGTRIAVNFNNMPWITQANGTVFSRATRN